MKKKWFVLIHMFVFGITTFSNVKAQSSASDKESARVFVQKFYDWYLVLWSESQKNPSRRSTHESAINQRPEYFDRQLLKAIAEDDSAQNKATDGIVGLDFDPFLRGQELWGKYQVGDVKQAGKKFLVEIRDIEKGKSKKEIHDAPLRVVVELVRRDRHWIFTNFIYRSPDGNTNLLSMLKDLKNDRDKSSK